MAQLELQADEVGVAGEEEAVQQNGHSTYAVFSVLSNVLDKDEVSLHEFEEKDRPKDDYIDHETLREWFSRRLKIAEEHHMSLREIWRNFCYEYRIYCSLPLFGNVVLRHVLQADPVWKGVTKVGDIKQKRYNLTWMSEPAGTEFEIDAFFARIKDEKEKVDRTKAEPKPAVPAAEPPAAAGVPRSPVFLDPTLLSEWWNRRLEPTDPSVCRMRMRDIYDRFVVETNVNMPKALFGELSVRYVLSSSAYANVVRKGKIHSKRYSLQWRNTPSVPAAASASVHPPSTNAATAPTPPVSAASAAAVASAAAAARASAEARWHSSLRAPGAPLSAASAASASAAFPRTATPTWGPSSHPSAPRVVNV